jgi:hypothetical protein
VQPAEGYLTKLTAEYPAATVLEQDNFQSKHEASYIGSSEMPNLKLKYR